MHICFIAPYANSYLQQNAEGHPGGAERQQYLLAKGLVQRGHRITFVTYESSANEGEIINGIDLCPTIPRPATLSNSPAVAKSMYRSMSEIDADIYYFRGTQKLCILAGTVCNLLGKPYVYHVANDADVGPERFNRYPVLVRYLFQVMLKRTSKVVAQKEVQATHLQENFGVRAVTIPNIYTIPDEDRIPDPSERDIFLWVGRLDRDQKQPERYLNLASQVPEFRFVMIGKGKDEDYHEFVHDRASHLSNVEHIEYVPPDEIDEYYRDAIALINTSAYEGFPNTFLEAWRYATPVISLNPVLDGLIEEEQMGYSDLNLDDATRCIRTLRENPDLVRGLGNSGREYVVQNHSIEKLLNRYEQLFIAAAD